MTISARRLRVPSLLLVGLLASLVAGCGQGGTTGAPITVAASGPPERARVSVAALPLVDFAALYYARDKGYFTDEGLTVDVREVQGASTAVPALLSGDLQFSIANSVSFLLATSAGVDLRLISDGTALDPDQGGVYVSAASPVRAPADLRGKTVAVNALQSISDVTTNAALADAGVQPGDVRYVELGFPEMLPALQSGSIDAAFLTEPFSGAAAAQGARRVVDSYGGRSDGLLAAAYMTTGTFAQQNPATVAAFRRALARAAKDLSDPATVRALLPTYTRISPAGAATVVLPEYLQGADPQRLQRVAGLLTDLGVIKEPGDVARLVLG